jgi:ubiquinol-cytochrome c reductase cytochrome c1 subunit
MKKIFISLLLATAAVTSALAAGGGIAWDKAPAKTTDMVALQNGAKIFVNYCQNCHAAAYMRFNKLKDLGLTDQQIKENLLFSTDKIGETMKVSMDVKNAKDWFGVVPPDLTLVARSRSDSGKGTGSDYLYTYLRTYYRDDTKPTGWNNLAYPNSAMPHVMWEWQGERKPIYEEATEHGKKVAVLKGWQQVSPGSMTPLQYDQSVGDLVGFLQWMSEPVQNNRVQIGVWVLLFLLLLTFAAWRLNVAFWKDVK